MISLMPATTAQDTSGAFAVLALLADPAAARKRLDELVSTARDLEAKRAELTEAKKEHEARSVALQSRAKNADAWEKRLEQREAAIKGAEDDLSAKVAAHNERAATAESEISRRTNALTKRESDAQRREQEVAARETNLAADRAKFDEDRAALDRKLAKAREFIQA